MNTKPNILLIMSDEHAPANMGCYGDGLGATPALDGLAERGVTFDAAYCNSPLCVPSRLSYTSCQYISRTGAWTNHCWLPSDDHPSFLHALKRAGYDTVLCGKQHYDRTRRYGFRYDLWPQANGAFKSGIGARRDPDDLTPNAEPWLSRSADFHPGNNSRLLDNDRMTHAAARAFITTRKRDDRPFFLHAGYTAPHFPLIVPQKYADRFYGRVPAPNVPEGLIDSLPLNYKHLRAGFGNALAEPQVERRGRDLYWALTAWFDDLVGELLETLERSDVADNTIVIYTSDHGENKGDHGLWWKNCMYDHGARVPLIVSWPKRWAGGQRRTRVCSLVDVVQTVIALGGGEPHEQMDGDSLVDYLDDERAGFKDFALSEYYGHNIASGFTMYRAGQWKYVYHARIDAAHGPERQLFDMHNDPGELHNLAADADQADRIAQMHQAMLDELGEDPDDIEQRSRADLARGYGRG